jgi:Protein of unknown function (DUF3108)
VGRRQLALSAGVTAAGPVYRPRSWTRRAVLVLLAMAVFGPTAARADKVVAFYSAYWAGLPVGQVRLAFQASASAYRDAIEIRTGGLPRLFTRFRATAEATGRLDPGKSADPQRYDARYDMKKRRNNRIDMQFVARDGVLIAERAGDDTNRKPPLAEKFRRDIVDPLSAFERVRATIAQSHAVPDTTFTVPVYDDTRRFDVVGRVLPRDRRAPGKLQVALILKPIAGFKNESSEDGDPENAPRPVSLTLSDDQKLLPLSMTVRIFYMPLVVQLDRICTGAEACPG